MRNRNEWRQSKFAYTDTGLRASNDPASLSKGSRLVADLQAQMYERLVVRYARGRLLDLGCGKVPLYKVYERLVDGIICVDWTKNTRAAVHLDAIADLNAPLPLQSESFDTILVTDVLEHIYSPAQLWHEISRLLTPSGTLILGVPFLYRIHEAPYDYYRYTEFQLRKSCENSGLDPVYLEPYGGSMETMADLTAKHLGRLGVVSDLHLELSRFAVKSIVGRRIYMLTSQAFPLGYGLVAIKRSHYRTEKMFDVVE